MLKNAPFTHQEDSLDKELIGMLSGVLVAASAVPYAIRTFQRKTKPNLMSWGLWSVIGFTLLVTYKDAGAEANVWPALFGFTNPCIIAAIGYWRSSEREPFGPWEWAALVGCLCSLAIWAELRGNKDLVQYGLYIAIIADLFAAIPTLHFVWTRPSEERPAPWILFAFAYGLGILAISEHSFSNYILPLYMCFGPVLVFYPLIRYRMRHRIPVTEWI